MTTQRIRVAVNGYGAIGQAHRGCRARTPYSGDVTRDARCCFLRHGASVMLEPRGTWRHPQAYDAQARALAGMLATNFQIFASAVSDDVRAAGPRVE